MDLKLAGSRAIVTGGSRGIGLETTRALLAEGGRVVTGSRSVSTELAETDAFPVNVDLTDPEGGSDLVAAALQRLGGIDLLVNNVGFGDLDNAMKSMRTDLIDLPDEVWYRTFEMNFFTTLRVTRAALPSLIENSGTIVNVSTAGARMVGAGAFDYNIAKGAVNSLTKVVSERYGAQGVRAVTVSPGPVATGLWTDPDGLHATVADEKGVSLEEHIGQLLELVKPSSGRITRPQEVARLILFLASPTNITGTDFIIDGGILKTV